MPKKAIPASVVIPTLGRDRLRLLRACLESLAACDTHPAEILVVDQSRAAVVAELVDRFVDVGATLIPCHGRGVSLGRNVGFRRAAYDVVFVTDDDCTVAPTWIDVGWKLISSGPKRIVTGRVLPVGDPWMVPYAMDPYAMDDPTPHEYPPGEITGGALRPNNMVLDRTLALRLGGFDERIRFAEDNDFCYRWLRAGYRIRYEPEMMVCHHEWRSRQELEELYRAHAVEIGVFYAKHLRQRDLAMCRFIAHDFRAGFHGLAARLIRGRPRWSDPRQALLRGLPVGLAKGWGRFRP